MIYPTTHPAEKKSLALLRKILPRRNLTPATFFRFERLNLGTVPGSAGVSPATFPFSAPDRPARRRRSQEVLGMESNVYKHESPNPPGFVGSDFFV
jgi:hypothetical protein